MRKVEREEIRSDLHRSYLLLGVLVFVLGGAAALLVRNRAERFEFIQHRDSRYHLETMVLCGEIERHVTGMRLELIDNGAGQMSEERPLGVDLAKRYVATVRNLHRDFHGDVALTPAVKRLQKAYDALEQRYNQRGSPEERETRPLLKRVRLRAEQLRRLHHAEHLAAHAKLRRSTQTWLWKLAGLAGIALLIGAIVLWRILDRSDKAVESWRRVDTERARLFDALDASFSEAYLVEAEGLRIAHANRGALASLGVPAAELHTMRLVDVAPELDEAAIAEVVSGVRRQLTQETVHRRADGSSYPVQISVQRIEQDGEGQLLAVAMDVSDLHEAREALHQAQKVEAAGQIAGGLAHDFNNLIMVIEGHAELLRMQRSTPALRAISEASARAGALTKQLLQFSRKSIVQPVVLDLNDMLTDVKYLLARLINANIKTRFEPASSRVSVKADRGQVQQVILNLCINAQDAMPDGGSLTVATGWAKREGDDDPAWSDDDDGDFAFLRVSDTGHGMDQATVNRIFEPFFTTKPVGRGTGLGLASVHSIVKESDGHVSVETAPGAGSRFTVYLPRCAKGPSGMHLISDMVDDGRGEETILVVDDDDLVADLIEDVLQRKGYNVLVASTPSEALKKAQEHAADLRLLVTDLVMPEMTGYELAKRIGHDLPDLPVIYISGYAPDRVIPDRRLDEQLTFLQKPFPPRDLVQAARRVLDRRAKD